MTASIVDHCNRCTADFAMIVQRDCSQLDDKMPVGKSLDNTSPSLQQKLFFLRHYHNLTYLYIYSRNPVVQAGLRVVKIVRVAGVGYSRDGFYTRWIATGTTRVSSVRTAVLHWATWERLATPNLE